MKLLSRDEWERAFDRQQWRKLRAHEREMQARTDSLAIAAMEFYYSVPAKYRRSRQGKALLIALQMVGVEDAGNVL